MNDISTRLSFGPVPSRRLGMSLGINNIPPKICTYSCVYCQLGRTVRIQSNRERFYCPEKIMQDVSARIERLKNQSGKIDFMTFVPDGEPTLDVNLGDEIDMLNPLGLPVAVITNSSLLHLGEVRHELSRADWVSVKIDTVQEDIWRKINRPSRDLKLSSVLDGIHSFSGIFKGTLAAETMIIQGLNENDACLAGVSAFLGSLKPDRVYLSVPTRPPAEHWVKAPDDGALNRAYQIISEKTGNVEYLTGYEGTAFASSGNAKEDILAISAVHPMRDDAVEDLLRRTGSGPEILERLLASGAISKTIYHGRTYYIRRFKYRGGRNGAPAEKEVHQQP